MFDSGRLILVVAAVLLRLVTMPIYLQAYLNMAHTRFEEQKKEAGRITNKELQKKVGNFVTVVEMEFSLNLFLSQAKSVVYLSGRIIWF